MTSFFNDNVCDVIMRPTKSPVAAFLSSSFSRESRKRVKRKIMHSRSLSVASTTDMKRSTTPQKVGHSMGLSINDVIKMYIRLFSLIQIYYEALVWSKKILKYSSYYGVGHVKM